MKAIIQDDFNAFILVTCTLTLYRSYLVLPI